MDISFEEASRLRNPLTLEEIRINGIKTFKRKALGLRGYLAFFGHKITQSTKTLDEVAELFLDSSMSSTREEAVIKAYSLGYVEKFNYSNNGESYRDLVLERVFAVSEQDKLRMASPFSNQDKIKISVWNHPDTTC